MLPNQFNPLNSFGINGDIIRVDKISGIDTRPDIDVDYPTEVSFYNINPDRTYESINLSSNFSIGHNSDLRYINFYNFNQDQLNLYMPVDSLSDFISNCQKLEKLNFDGDIIINSGLWDTNNYSIMNAFRHVKELDFSNIILNVRLLNSGFNGDFFASDSNIFGSKKGEATAIKEYNIDLYNAESLQFAFSWSLPAKNWDFNRLLGIKDTDTDISIETLYINNICTTDGNTNPYNGITNFFSNVPFSSLDRAIEAFTNLELHKTDVKTLANNLPTYTSGPHEMGVGLKDSTVTQEEITEIENMYTSKGWTLSLNQITG